MKEPAITICCVFCDGIHLTEELAERCKKRYKKRIRTDAEFRREEARKINEMLER